MWWRRVSAVSAVLQRGAKRPSPEESGHGLSAPARPVYLDGNLSGDLTTSEPVIVGETALIRANIRAPSVVIAGQVFGNVIAENSIELRYPARVVGNLNAPSVIIEPGVHFAGRCLMGPGHLADAIASGMILDDTAPENAALEDAAPEGAADYPTPPGGLPPATPATTEIDLVDPVYPPIKRAS